MKLTPRAYQVTLVERIRVAVRIGQRRILLVLPTGAGKTACAAMIIELALRKGSRILFLVHRKELVDQLSKLLDEMGIDHGIIKGNHWRTRPEYPVQIGSIQTLNATRCCRRCKDDPQTRPGCEACHGKGKVKRDWPPAEIVIIDEAHRSLANSYTQITDKYPGSIVLGLTGTPWRLDGRGLGAAFDEIVSCIQIEELTRLGYLVPLRVYAPEVPDLRKIGKSHGDYEVTALAELMDQDGLSGDIVEHYRRYGESRCTVGFAVNVAHAKHLAERFREAGIPSEYVNGKMPESQREAIFERLSRGETRVLWNVDIATEGIDIPQLSCVILARPTKSLTRFLQAVGRVMRPYPGKLHALVLDHAGCVHEHGLPSDERQWTLDDRRAKDEPTPPADLVVCEDCGMVYRDGRLGCPACRSSQIRLLDPMPLERQDQELVPYEEIPKYSCSQCRSSKLRLRKQSRFQFQATCRDCGRRTYVSNRDTVKLASLQDKRLELERLRHVASQHGFSDNFANKQYFSIFHEHPEELQKALPWYTK